MAVAAAGENGRARQDVEIGLWRRPGGGAGRCRSVKKCRRVKVTDEQTRAIPTMKTRGEKIPRIARTVSLSRLTIDKVLKSHEQGLMESNATG